MSGHNPAVSVIIAVYEHPDFLEKVFLSLRNQTFGDFEVVVADDGSGPEIANLLGRYAGQFPYPLQHVRHEHRGFRKTVIVNKAVRRARADYLVFMDGDSIAHHRFLEFHYRRRKPGRVLAGRRVKLGRDLSASMSNEDVQRKTVERRSFWGRDCDRTGRRHGTFVPGAFYLRNCFRKTHKIVGANFSLHKSDFARVNGYDERIVGRGLEDNNLDARLKRAGFQVCSVVHEALQYHLYHKAEPIPHSTRTIEAYKNVTGSWYTPYGMDRHEQ